MRVATSGAVEPRSPLLRPRSLRRRAGRARAVAVQLREHAARRDWTYAMQQLRAAMDSLIKIGGSSGLMDDNPVQRCWRDVHAISSHVEPLDIRRV